MDAEEWPLASPRSWEQRRPRDVLSQVVHRLNSAARTARLTTEQTESVDAFTSRVDRALRDPVAYAELLGDRPGGVAAADAGEESADALSAREREAHAAQEKREAREKLAARRRQLHGLPSLVRSLAAAAVGTPELLGVSELASAACAGPCAAYRDALMAAAHARAERVEEEEEGADDEYLGVVAAIEAEITTSRGSLCTTPIPAR